MNDVCPTSTTVDLFLATPEQTTLLAEWIANRLIPGDVILVEGALGAGKSHFCRGIIQSRLEAEGRHEDVPSPTYTLVQVYEFETFEIWHADLYRLSTPEEAAELGLEEAFESAVCLVEWPDRLGPARPTSSLTLRISQTQDPNARHATFLTIDPKWTPLLTKLQDDWRSRDE